MLLQIYTETKEHHDSGYWLTFYFFQYFSFLWQMKLQLVLLIILFLLFKRIYLFQNLWGFLSSIFSGWKQVLKLYRSFTNIRMNYKYLTWHTKFYHQFLHLLKKIFLIFDILAFFHRKKSIAKHVRPTFVSLWGSQAKNIC